VQAVIEVDAKDASSVCSHMSNAHKHAQDTNMIFERQHGAGGTASIRAIDLSIYFAHRKLQHHVFREKGGPGCSVTNSYIRFSDATAITTVLCYTVMSTLNR